jgi:leucyl-tRNA synthetase
LHLLYARFVDKWFCTIIKGVPVPCGSEPYVRDYGNQGMILGEGGVKMSKSKGNVINPDGYYSRVWRGHCCVLYEMFMGPFDQSIKLGMTTESVKGMFRFLKKVWALQV